MNGSSYVQRALISVSNKAGVVALAQSLAAMGIELVATGRTHQLLIEAGLNVRQVTDLTGFPEILDGRVKTLHPAIHGGILANRALPTHHEELTTHGIQPIDMVVVNLYPFAETISQPDSALAEALEQIDIGGVALLRAAAKNFPSVLVLVNPDDYAPVLDALKAGQVSLALRQRLAATAFAHTAAYDATIANYVSDTLWPQTLPMAWQHTLELRYGENPHQRGALYGSFFDYFAQLHGKALSYTNILDIGAAQELIEAFDARNATTVAIVKHTNPCGVGTAATPLEAWQRAYATDPLSPFGGIIVTNRTCDSALASAIDEIFSEIIIAPDFEPAALEMLQKKKNRRLMRSLRPVTHASKRLLRSVPGGVLVQEADHAAVTEEPWTVVTKREPTEDEWQALRFAWRVVKHVKSNAIVYANSYQTLGIGAGQMSRVDSAQVAAWKAQQAGLSLAGSVVASDALFPFADGVETAIAAGATAIIQPGGSVRDEEVIAAANQANATMIFTGRRHFLH
ncbi:MAG: bifunctional phosphoribosylaminoimidazolecarboxamide formyltransferase/IMP cyclohydrolase [Chloroflexaceae bacterium]|nr:bifunctional phosphoribosylaminoimidazolecarboxamide formyltransferase/IMP cyclohydrolase [Chloroflexaceae bacterium]